MKQQFRNTQRAIIEEFLLRIANEMLFIAETERAIEQDLNLQASSFDSRNSKSPPTGPTKGDLMSGVKWWYEMYFYGTKVNWEEAAAIVQCDPGHLRGEVKNKFDAAFPEYREQLTALRSKRRKRTQSKADSSRQKT